MVMAHLVRTDISFMWISRNRRVSSLIPFSKLPFAPPAVRLFRLRSRQVGSPEPKGDYIIEILTTNLSICAFFSIPPHQGREAKAWRVRE